MIESLIWVLTYVCYCVIGGLMFWLRGSAVFEQLTGRGKTTGDMVWAISMAGLAAPLYWNTASPLWNFAGLTFAFFLGGRLPWWRSLSMGRNPADGYFWNAFARHTVRGLFWVAPAAFVIGILGGNPLGLLVAGLMAGVLWDAGWRIKESGGGFFNFEATEIGELYFGLMIGGAIFWTL